MWSDELDKKIKETTEGNHPAYDDKAWDKMEVLLDKHLPPEKKRRRFILLLLPLVLVGIGVYFILQRQIPAKGITAGEQEKAVIQPKTPDAQQPLSKDAAITTAPGAASSEKTILLTTPDLPVVKEKKLRTGPTPQGELLAETIAIANSKKLKQARITHQPDRQHKSIVRKKYTKDTEKPVDDIAVQQFSGTKPVVVTDKPAAQKIQSTISGNADVPLTKKSIAVDDKKQPDSSNTKDEIVKSKPQKAKSSVSGKFSLNLSAGPDISSVGIDNPGKLEFQYGVGISYELTKQLSIRAGFFAGRKIYSADSTEYHSSYYPPKLQRIDANCLVYEIPVNLIYNFAVNKKHNWFVSGGVSSYLMKKETYNYFYENAWGQTQSYSHTYKNENSHLFSVINVSGGYRYHFTDRLSLMAEPYVRIPVSGIGSGKVKLNSGGILFSLGFKPFLKRK